MEKLWSSSAILYSSLHAGEAGMFLQSSALCIAEKKCEPNVSFLETHGQAAKVLMKAHSKKSCQSFYCTVFQSSTSTKATAHLVPTLLLVFAGGKKSVLSLAWWSFFWNVLTFTQTFGWNILNVLTIHPVFFNPNSFVCAISIF